MLKFEVTIDDADREAGIAQARAAYNKGLPEGVATIDDDTSYAQMLATNVFDAFVGSAKANLVAKLQQIDDLGALAAIATAIDVATPIKVAPSPVEIVQP